MSRNRQTFLTAIEAQLNGTRILALIVLAVCLAGGVYWLVGTTGSPIIGISFIALALVLAITVYSFVQVMYMFTGGARGGLRAQRGGPPDKKKPT